MKIKDVIKRPGVWGTIVSIAVMAAVAVAFFYPDNFEGNVLSQDDVIQGISNGQEARAFHEATGETTRWTNSLFSGMPTFQISPSYPSDGLFKWVNKVYSLSLPGCSGYVMMMMAGMYIMLMMLGMRWYVSLLGAIAWGFSSYYIIIIGAGHLWKFYTLTYVPPTIGGIILAYRGRLLAGGAWAAAGLMMQLSWNHVQMTYYFFFVAAILAVCYLVEAFRTKALARWGKASGVLAVSFLLGAAANLPNLYMTSRYAPESIRGGHSELTLGGSEGASTGGLDKDYITQYSYGRSETFTLLIPNVKGGASALPKGGRLQAASLDQLDGAPAAIHDAKLDGMEQFLGLHSQYFGEPESTNGPVYVGVIICALFLLGCIIVRGPLKWAMLAATLLSIGLAWGRNFMPLTDLFINLVPGYNKFRTPESILVIAQFAMPVLGILALRELLSGQLDRRRALGISFGTVALFCLIGWLFPGFYGSTDYAGDAANYQRYMSSYINAGYDPDQVQEAFGRAYTALTPVVEKLRHSLVSADSLRSLLFIVAGAAVLYWGLTRKRRGVTVGLLAVLVLADLYGVDKRYINAESFNRPVEQVITPDRADLAILADTAMNYRVMPMDYDFMRPNRSYFHKSVGGYHAAKLSRYNDLINYYLTPAAFGQTSEGSQNVVNMLNTKYLIESPDSVTLNPDALGNAWLLSEIVYVDTPDDEFLALQAIDPATEAVADKRFSATLGTAVEPARGDTVYETSYAPNRLTYRVNTARGGIVAFSEIYFPWGWEATIDGEPAELGRIDYVLRALRVPAGSHEIVMTFRPRAVQATCTIAVIAVILIYLTCAVALFRALRSRL